MDQQSALRWIQRTTAQFDGDPHNVTIAGQSAHGAHGLFQRAIVQSGASRSRSSPLRVLGSRRGRT
jgi:para-nitrobenzyl esterase